MGNSLYSGKMSLNWVKILAYGLHGYSIYARSEWGVRSTSLSNTTSTWRSYCVPYESYPDVRLRSDVAPVCHTYFRRSHHVGATLFECSWHITTCRCGFLCIWRSAPITWMTSRELKKSTPRAVPHKRCFQANLSWLGDFEEILSSLEIFAFWETPFFDNFFIL